MTDTDAHWIGVAIDLAADARRRGDHPFGALLVVDGDVVMAARNAVNTRSDVTQHAELRLVSKASRALPPDVLAATTLYTSTEPCAMCAGAIYWAGIRRIVFGLRSSELAMMADGAGLHTTSSEVLGGAAEPVAIDGPIREHEAREVHAGFWR